MRMESSGGANLQKNDKIILLTQSSLLNDFCMILICLPETEAVRRAGKYEWTKDYFLLWIYYFRNEEI